MRLRSFISLLVRWFITWPVIVIIALNIENIASIEGISNIFLDNWNWIKPTLNWMHSWATSNIILYPSLFLAGCIFYEWVQFTSAKIEDKNSKYRIWVTKKDANMLSLAFFKNGFLRRYLPLEFLIESMNDKLHEMGMPLLPSEMSTSDEINKTYARYLRYINEGDFDFAKVFIEKMRDHIELETAKLQSPQYSE